VPRSTDAGAVRRPDEEAEPKRKADDAALDQQSAIGMGARWVNVTVRRPRAVRRSDRYARRVGASLACPCEGRCASICGASSKTFAMSPLRTHQSSHAAVDSY
jgi:hypothetical protein